MALDPPNLDSRTFQDLVREARARIPRYTPEWTNLNESDPGMTLVQLQAWLTETILHQLNRLPELNYVKFLQLLNVKPRPASAARTDLTFSLKKLKQLRDPLTVFVPRRTQVSVDDPNLEREVVFETDETLTALNATIAVVLTSEASEERARNIVTEYDAKSAQARILHSFRPFGSSPSAGDAAAYVGILLRPHAEKTFSHDRFPAGPLDIWVHVADVDDRDPEGQVLRGPVGSAMPLGGQLGAEARLRWSVYTGQAAATDFQEEAAWRHLVVRHDGTGGLNRTGYVVLDMPADLPATSFWRLPREFWKSLGLNKPPATQQELLDDLESNDLTWSVDTLEDEQWIELGVPEDQLEALLQCTSIEALHEKLAEKIESGQLSLRTNALDSDDWLALDVGYDDPAVPERELIWLRVELEETQGYHHLPVVRFALNTVGATAAITRVEEHLGQSNGRPSQSFQLRRTPVYVDPGTQQPELELDVIEGAEDRQEISSRWTLAPDFYQFTAQDEGGRVVTRAVTADSEVFVLDESRGRITFGDGIRGRIPVAGARIVARRYRYGGGAHGNAGAGLVTELKSVVPEVDAVVNLRPAAGGKDAETNEEAQLRAPHALRARDRCVTAEDFAYLARHADGVSIHSAYALANTKLDLGNPKVPFVPKLGAVTVVILPLSDDDKPEPTREQRQLVGDHLNRRRLITTELYIAGPRYQVFERLHAVLHVHKSHDLRQVHEASLEILHTYFHPIRGGDDGTGWPFGNAIDLGSIYERLLSVDGVRRVTGLDVKLEAPDSADGGASGAPDEIPIPNGYLLHLPRTQGVVDLKVIYEGRG